MPGLLSGAARFPRGRSGGAAPGRVEPAPAAALHLRGAALPSRGHAGGPAHPPQLGHLHLQHPLHRQLQGDPLGGPGQAGHRQVLTGSEQKEGSHANLAERLQDILGHVPAGAEREERDPHPSPPAPQGLRCSMMDSQALQQTVALSPCRGKASSGNLASRESAKGLTWAVASLCLPLPTAAGVFAPCPATGTGASSVFCEDAAVPRGAGAVDTIGRARTSPTSQLGHLEHSYRSPGRELINPARRHPSRSSHRSPTKQ